jgi:hypothetical protein
MAADDGLVFAPGQDRLDEPELSDASLKRVKFLVADPSRIGWVRTKLVDWDLFDRQRGQGSLDRHRRTSIGKHTSQRQPTPSRRWWS